MEAMAEYIINSEMQGVTTLESIQFNAGSYLANQGGEAQVDAEFYLLDVPYVQQYLDLPEQLKPIIGWTACGPATLSMVLNYLGEGITLASIIESLPNFVYEKGVGFYDLKPAATLFNKNYTELEMSVASIKEVIKQGNPVIVNIQNYTGVHGHAIVVVGFTNDSLIVHDPFTRSYELYTIASDSLLNSPQGFLTPLGTKRPFYLENPS